MRLERELYELWCVSASPSAIRSPSAALTPPICWGHDRSCWSSQTSAPTSETLPEDSIALAAPSLFQGGEHAANEGDHPIPRTVAGLVTGDEMAHPVATHICKQRPPEGVMPKGNPTVLTFAPETWSAVDAFIALYSGTYLLDRRASRTLGASAVISRRPTSWWDSQPSCNPISTSTSTNLRRAVSRRPSMDRNFCADRSGDQRAIFLDRLHCQNDPGDLRPALPRIQRFHQQPFRQCHQDRRIA